MLWLLLTLVPSALCRGRYEFIDDADLPAFYSLRSAQLAQQAAALQGNPAATSASVPATPLYSPYYQYQLYQPTAEAQGSPTATVQAAAPAVQYSPYLYSQQLYRPQTPQIMTHQHQPRVFYSPLAAYYGSSMAQPATAQLAKNKKKVV